MRKFLSIILITSFIIMQFAFIPSAFAQEGPALNAEGAILIDASSGQVLYEANSNNKWYPASTTKVMTLALAMEALQKGKVKLTDMVKASEYACGFGGSQVYLDPREEFSLKEMLIAIAVGSANDASVAVAEHIAGTEENFVKIMNEKAKELGCKNTHFVNCHGLHDDNHYTTPSDLSIMAKFLTTFPQILEYTTIKHYTFRPEPRKLVLDNTNKLLWRYEGTLGLKTGTTSQAKRNLVSLVNRDNLKLIGVVMGADNKGGHFSESIKLYNWAFSNFGFKKYYGKNQLVAKVNIGKGEKDQVGAIAENDVGALMIKGEEKNDIKIKVSSPKSISAPIKKGQKLGDVIVYKNTKEINKIDLVAKEDVKRTNLWGLFKKTIIQLISF